MPKQVGQSAMGRASFDRLSSREDRLPYTDTVKSNMSLPAKPE